MEKLTKETFIEKAKEIHDNKYDYSKVDYINQITKVCIICPIHGEFFQTPSNHLKWGCKLCGNEKASQKRTLTTENFILKAKKIHGDRYDYSKVKYVNNHEKVCIICPEHGEFWQTPNNHLSGLGCKKCGYENAGKKRRLNNEEFIDKSKKIHGDKYDYSNIDYVNYNTKIKIICKKHGEFFQTPDDHLQGKGCPFCGNIESKYESEIYNYVCEILNNENIEKRKRNIIQPYEIDIYIPNLKIGIEYNGIYWHSDNYGKDKNYHLNKLELCKKNGISLIQIFEDEYFNNKDIVKSKIKHILGLSKNKKVYGRKCFINEIQKEQAKSFLIKNHIQGFSPSTIYIGAFYNEELVSVMTFKKETKDGNNWELNRFASDINLQCVGVGGKLFSYFVKKYNPLTVKSFADRRWVVNEDKNFYTKIGFYRDNYTRPDYRYFRKSDGIVRQHKFNFRKQKLHKKYGFPLTMTESEMTKKLGYSKIWDCGLIRYVWKQV